MGKDLKGKELGKGISQRKNGIYCARYVDKYGVRQSIYDKDLREVNRRLKIMIGRNAEGKVVKECTLTLDQWYQVWIHTYKEGMIRENTKLRYDTLYNKHIKPFLGKKVLNRISKIQCVQLLKDIKEKGLGWETQNSARIMMADLFNRALEDDFVLKNPMKGVRLPSNKPDEERKILSIEEQKLFYEASAGTWYDNAFIVAVNTGLRPGDDDDKIRLNQRKPSKYKGLSRFGPEKNLQRINKFMKERPIFYKNLIQMKENFRFYLRCFYCITKVVILQFNSENRTELARNG